MEDLHTRLTRVQRIADRGAAPLSSLALVLLLVSVVGVVGVVLLFVGLDAIVSVPLVPVLVVSVSGFVLAYVAATVLSGMFHRRFPATWEEAGVTDPDGVTLEGREARDLIADPGTVIGRDTREERA